MAPLAPLTHVFNEFQRALACANTENHELFYVVPDLFLPDILRHVNDVCGCRILAVGGSEDSEQRECEELDLGTMRWEKCGVVYPADYPNRQVATRLLSGAILSVAHTVDSALAWLLEPHEDVISQIETPPGKPVPGNDIVTLHDGRALTPVENLDGHLILQLFKQGPPHEWSLLRFSNTGDRAWTGVAIVVLDNGQPMIMGGFDDSRESPRADSLIWSSTTELYVNTKMKMARASHAAVKLPDGRVLVSGGRISVTGGGLFTTSSCEIYNPRNDTWNYTGNMTSPRSGHRMLLLPALNLVIAAGGVVVYGPLGVRSEKFELDSCEFFQISSGLWRRAPRMRHPRTMFCMALRGALPPPLPPASVPDYEILQDEGFGDVFD
jgi:hypothetical protein